MKAQKTRTEHPSRLFITDNFPDFGRMPEAVENNKACVLHIHTTDANVTYKLLSTSQAEVESQSWTRALILKIRKVAWTWSYIPVILAIGRPEAGGLP